MIVLIQIALVVIALCMACAVWHAVRRAPGIGLRTRHPQFDPFDHAFGDVPGFSRAQLDRFEASSRERAKRDVLNRSLDISPSATALRRIAGGRHSDGPSGVSAARNSSTSRMQEYSDLRDAIINGDISAHRARQIVNGGAR